MKPQIEWYVKPSKWRRDPVFYKYEEGNDVAKVTLNGRSVYVACDGITRVTVMDKKHEREVDYLRYGDDWIHAGIRSDKKMQSIGDRLVWDNNSWFDLYEDDGTHIDCVTFDIYEAVDAAVQHLIDGSETA